MHVFIKIIVTLLITMAGIYPYINAGSKPGIVDELNKIGLIPVSFLMVLFFTAIGFYCKALQNTLTLVKPENRKTKPRSVWLMFLIPYNFFEDFFIVAHVSNSLAQESLTNEKLKGFKDFGFVTGMGWATAQIISFYPGITGQIAGIVGTGLWIKHWLFIKKINSLLAVKPAPYF